MDRPTWAETALDLAEVVAKRAACTRRQVGAAVVSADKMNIWLGYNGAPSGVTHCTDGGCPRGKLTYDECAPFSGYDNCIAIHAEDNALRRAGKGARGGIIAITCQPCSDCAKLIEAAGIAEIIYPGS